MHTKEDYDDWYIGQWVWALAGPFNGLRGRIVKIDHEINHVTVAVNLFGRDHYQEVGFHEIRPED